MDETVTHICTICTRVKFYTRMEIFTPCVPFIRHLIVSIRTRFHLIFGIRYTVLRRFEYAGFECSKHYANTPMQYTSIIYSCENDNFQVKIIIFFSSFFFKHFLRYILETPHRGVSNEYPQSMFYSKNKKNVYPCVPQVYYVRGYTSHGHVSLMEGNDSNSEV